MIDRETVEQWREEWWDSVGLSDEYPHGIVVALCDAYERLHEAASAFIEEHGEGPRGESYPFYEAAKAALLAALSGTGKDT